MRGLIDLEVEVETRAALRNHEVIFFLLQENIPMSVVCAHGRTKARRKKLANAAIKYRKMQCELQHTLNRSLQERHSGWTAWIHGEWLSASMIQRRIFDIDDKVDEINKELMRLDIGILKQDECGMCPMCNPVLKKIRENVKVEPVDDYSDILRYGQEERTNG